MRTLIAAVLGLTFTTPLWAAPQDPPPPMAPSTPTLQPPGFAGPSGTPMFRSLAQEFKELIPMLIEALTDADPEVRQHSALALSSLGRDALPPLTESLTDASKERRAAAAYALGQMGVQARDVLPTLLKLLKDEDASVRRATAQAVNRIVATETTMGGYPQALRGGFGGPPMMPGITSPVRPIAPPLPIPDPTPRPLPPPEKKAQ